MRTVTRSVSMLLILIIFLGLNLNCAKYFYNESGVRFVQQYGMQYSFVQQFFGIHNSHRLRNPNSSRNDKIEDNYFVRNQSQFSNYGSGDIERFHVSNINRIDNRFYSRFRVGPSPEDRFYSVFLHGDPWAEKSLVKDISVNFVGACGGFESNMSFENYFCRFLYPVKMQRVVPLDVLTKSTNPVLYKQMDNRKSKILRCLLPKDLLEVIQSGSNNDPQHIRLDLLKNDGEPVLSGITVHRLHEMDRRSFNVSFPF